MVDDSIIKRSGQSWRAVISFGAVLCGSAAMFYGLAHLRGSPEVNSFALVFLGVLGIAFGFIFACTTIRCAKCGARWVWLSVKGQSAGNWLAWLLSQSTCPICKSAGERSAA